MLSEKMQEALNAQLNAEYYSSYLYLAMAAYFDANNLSGAAHWMKLQAQEELGHALKFYEYINDRRGRVTLRAIQAPPGEWASPLAAFEEAFAHEQKVTGLIHDLVKQATAEKDAATGIFLQWFVTEQVEEEKSVADIVARLELVGALPQGLLLVDRELAQRV